MLPVFQTGFDEPPSVSFGVSVGICTCDPVAKAVLDFLADQAVGMDFYAIAENADAKGTVDEFSEKNQSQ